MKWVSILSLAFLFPTVVLAKAENKASACEKDVAKLCADVEPGGGKIAKCLRENKDNVSAECKAEWEQTKTAFKELKEACHEDYQKFCEDVKPGKGAVMKCMRKNRKKLSEACKAEYKEMKEKRKATRKGS